MAIVDQIHSELSELLYSREAAGEGGSSADVELVVEPGLIVKSEDIWGLYQENDFGSRVISPAGGALLIRLYLAGLLDTGGKLPTTPHESATAYASSEQALRELATKRRDDIQRYQESLKHPENFSEDDFAYSLLNDIFFAHNIKDGSLNIGGVSVEKSLSCYTSNSGKTRDFEVLFSWVSPKGGRQVISKESRYVGNRRNDSSRNWGLYE